jgi:hypothetical protein
MERLRLERGASVPAPPRSERLLPGPSAHIYRAPAVPAPARSPVRDAAEAYQRHLDDIRRQLRGRDIDASRVDGAIAVRLRATGYDRGQVSQAIANEAAKLRPGEERDWSAYGVRTATHAFGPAGDRQLHLFQDAREALLAIEGRLRPPEPTMDIRRRRGPDLGR